MEKIHSVLDLSHKAWSYRPPPECSLSIHPHELIFNKKIENGQEILCRWCLRQVQGANYNCKECSFFVHPHCARGLVRDASHKWIIQDRDGCHSCCRCGAIVPSSAVSPTSYLCRRCNTCIHETCAKDVPREIKHCFHRKHTLLLHSNCEEKAMDPNRGLAYYCKCCEFKLDMRTTLQPPLCLQEPVNPKHQFTRLMRSEHSYARCDACGLGFKHFGFDGPLMCTICHIVVHDACTSVPRTINIPHHQIHPLTHTFFFLLKEQNVPPVDQLNCRICYDNVDKDFGGYYCADCQFAVHLNCGRSNQISTNNPTMDRQDPVDDSLNEVGGVKDELPVEIKRFIHEHKLSLGDEIEGANVYKCCDGCARPISFPFYRCVDCNFFLHKACIDLPNQITRDFHEHPLTLRPSEPGNNDTFSCYLCSNRCNGFRYACEECHSFRVDVRCTSILRKHRHPAHDHTLSLTRRETGRIVCDSCGDSATYLFQCSECQFGIDFRCATLPFTARYWFHEHPLVLTYRTIDDGSDEYYCDICEEERDSDHWYYYCAQCDYAGHPKCALGSYPYLLAGRLYDITRSFFTLQGSDFEHRINLCGECRLLPLIPKTVDDHKLHKHPLIRCKNDIEIRYCDICREVIYASVLLLCRECGFTAHFKCVLRDAFTVERRQLNLRVVRRTNWGCIPCMVCDEDCRDACLQCPNAECTFCLHFDCAEFLFLL